MSGRYLFPVVRIFLLIACLLLQSASYAHEASEPQTKAAFLVNFLKYMEWPTAKPSVTICLFGNAPVGSYLESYQGRLIAGRELRIHRVTGPSEVAECHLLFIPDHQEARFSAILDWVEQHSVLTVSDAEIFTRYGGAIALIREDGRLQFDISANALRRAGLKPSSQLMKLARSVKGV